MFSGGKTDCCPHGAWRGSHRRPRSGAHGGEHRERRAHKMRRPAQHAGIREAPGLGSGRHTGSGSTPGVAAHRKRRAPGAAGSQNAAAGTARRHPGSARLRKRQRTGSGGHETSCRPKTTKADCRNSRPSVTAFPQLSVLERRLVRNGELLTSLGTTGRQHLASVGRSHTLTETMLIDSLPARGLVCSLHCHSCIVFIVLDYFTDCKSTTKKLSAKIFPENISSGSGEKRRILPIFIEK